MTFKTEFPRARSPSCSLKFDSVQTHSIPRAWKISLSCQAVTGNLSQLGHGTLNSRAPVVVLCFQERFCGQVKTVRGYHWFPGNSASFVAPHCAENTTKKRFVEFETFGNSFRKVCNFQSVVSLRQIGTFSFNFSHQKQNVRKYWSPMALHCFFSDFFSGLPTAETVFFKNFGFQKGQKTTCYDIE